MKIEQRAPLRLGVAARLPELTPRDLGLMKQAGIEWLRCGDFSVDYAAVLAKKPQGVDYLQAKKHLRALCSEGFQLIGITPSPRHLSQSIGEPGTREYCRNYGLICAFLAREFRGVITWWQVANELDIWIFRDALTLTQSVDFLKSGIRAMKNAEPNVRVGINITLFPSRPGEVEGNTEAHEGLTLARGIYGDPDLPVDYAGFDSYPGTWREGGTESWQEYLEGFYRLTGKPIFIQEFGYSGAGECMTSEEIRCGLLPCEAKKWKFSWRGSHTPERQADFIRESIKVFTTCPYVIGAIYYNWKDAQNCWQCKEPDCPAETAWGLLDSKGNMKVSYEAFKDASANLLASSSVSNGGVV